jgi:hypothetical protein
MKARRAAELLRKQTMLTFDDHFASDDGFGCVLWATDEPANRRVRFNIGSEIFSTCCTAKVPCITRQM